MKTTVWVRIDIRHPARVDGAIVRGVVDDALDAGTLQDAVNEFARDRGIKARVAAAHCEASPPAAPGSEAADDDSDSADDE